MITVVFSLDPGSGEHRVEKILEWSNFAEPEDRIDHMDEIILELERRYAGQRQVNSQSAQNLLLFFQQNPQFTSPGSASKGHA